MVGTRVLALRAGFVALQGTIQLTPSGSWTRGHVFRGRLPWLLIGSPAGKEAKSGNLTHSIGPRTETGGGQGGSSIDTLTDIGLSYY